MIQDLPFNKPIYIQGSVCEECINLIDAVKAYSMLTNCTVLLYDCLNQSICFANISNVAIESHKTLKGLQDHLGDSLLLLKNVFQQKACFLRQVSDADKGKMVISGSLYGHSYCPAINRVGRACFYFLGVPVSFTSSGDLHYELVKIYFGRGNDRELEIYNGETGERWRQSPVLNKWTKMASLSFSDLEKQVISLSIIDLSAKEIAERVCRSEVTVKKARARIMQAVGASTMTEAAFMLSHYRFI